MQPIGLADFQLLCSVSLGRQAPDNIGCHMLPLTQHLNSTQLITTSRNCKTENNQRREAVFSMPEVCLAANSSLHMHFILAPNTSLFS